MPRTHIGEVRGNRVGNSCAFMALVQKRKTRIFKWADAFEPLRGAGTAMKCFVWVRAVQQHSAIMRQTILQMAAVEKESSADICSSLAALLAGHLSRKEFTDLHLTVSERYESLEKALSAFIRPNARKPVGSDFLVPLSAVFQSAPQINEELFSATLKGTHSFINSPVFSKIFIDKGAIHVILDREEVFKLSLASMEQFDFASSQQKQMPGKAFCIITSMDVRLEDAPLTAKELRAQVAGTHACRLLAANALPCTLRKLSEFFTIESPHYVSPASREASLAQFVHRIRASRYFEPDTSMLDVRAFAQDSRRKGTFSKLSFSTFAEDDIKLMQLFALHLLLAEYTTVVCCVPAEAQGTLHTLDAALAILAEGTTHTPMPRLVQALCAPVHGLATAAAVRE